MGVRSCQIRLLPALQQLNKRAWRLAAFLATVFLGPDPYPESHTCTYRPLILCVLQAKAVIVRRSFQISFGNQRLHSWHEVPLATYLMEPSALLA